MPQALDALKREMQKENAGLQQKEAALRTATAQKQELETLIKANDNEDKLAKEKIIETDRNSRKLEEEVKKLRLDQTRKNRELQEISRQSQDALKGVKR